MLPDERTSLYRRTYPLCCVRAYTHHRDSKEVMPLGTRVLAQSPVCCTLPVLVCRKATGRGGRSKLPETFPDVNFLDGIHGDFPLHFRPPAYRKNQKQAGAPNPRMQKEKPSETQCFQGFGGRYRTRTCDPLHVKQVL